MVLCKWLALNLDKSEEILLRTCQQAHSYSSLDTVNVAGSQIPSADHIKILGVTLDKNLSMNNHVNAVCKFCSLSYPRATPHPFLYISRHGQNGCVCSQTSPNSKKHRTSSPMLLPVLLNRAVHVLSSSSSTGPRLNTASTSK